MTERSADPSQPSAASPAATAVEVDGGADGGEGVLRGGRDRPVECDVAGAPDAAAGVVGDLDRARWEAGLRGDDTSIGPGHGLKGTP